MPVLGCPSDEDPDNLEHVDSIASMNFHNMVSANTRPSTNAGSQRPHNQVSIHHMEPEIVCIRPTWANAL